MALSVFGGPALTASRHHMCTPDNILHPFLIPQAGPTHTSMHPTNLTNSSLSEGPCGLSTNCVALSHAAHAFLHRPYPLPH